MPTGTGKTETMLAFMVANQCRKVFVVVPSDALRSQTYNKFRTLGLLPKIGVVDTDIQLPIVKKIRNSMSDEDWRSTIDNSNVVVTTMAIATGISQNFIEYIKDNISYLIVDEAHHSKAETWNQFIYQFPSSKVILFTATPFRNDGKKLSGKIIFNFPLKKAQEQGYYKKINYCPVLKYTQEDADLEIASKAVNILRQDLKKGYDHILMARCKDKKRAMEVFQIYSKYSDLNPVVVYSGMPNGIATLKAIKEKRHRIIVCVNMLGEGYDLPQLKIAAVHDEKQSLAVTLQFIGRFTRTNETNLGQASFITNIAYPPIQDEINSLYQNDADWNYILPRLSQQNIKYQEQLHEFLESFNGDIADEISLENIRPALSTEVYTTDSTTTRFSNWEKALKNRGNFDVVLHAMSQNALVIVIGKKTNVVWGNTKTVKNLNWDIIIVYFDPRNKRVYLNSSFKIYGKTFLEKIFSGIKKIEGERVYRVFANVNRIRLFNVGARLRSRDISFQSYIGSSVEDGLSLLKQGKIFKNNVYGIGFKNGIKTSIGCSNNGKIWSRERADLMYFQNWCNEIGDAITNDSIPTDVVLKNSLHTENIKSFPNAWPISADWNSEIYEHSSLIVNVDGTISSFDDIELSVRPDDKNSHRRLKVSFILNDKKCEVLMVITEEGHISFSKDESYTLIFKDGEADMDVNSFFANYPLQIYFSDNSILDGNKLMRPNKNAPVIPDDLITTFDWEGVDLSIESQGSRPYIRKSIQFYMVEQIKSKFDCIIDDDGSGEISDLIGISETQEKIDITLFHLKYAHNGKVSNNIQNLYEVCGQAQKSIKWKYIDGNKIFDHILRRNEQKEKSGRSSSIIKGSIDDLLKLREEAYNKKEVSFHVVIVQPGLSKTNCSNDIKILLGNTVEVLQEMSSIDCRVICSK